MIFRTITDEATGATNAIGLFGNSLADIKRNIKTGQGIRYSLFDGKSFTEKDITAIKNYANALDNGSTRAQAFNNNLKGCSVAAKQYIVNSAKAGQSTKEMVAGLESQAIAAKASAVAMKAASIAANMIITVAIIQGIQLVVKGISKLNSEYANLEKQIEKIESKYNEQIQSIEKLNQKIKENNEQIEEINKLETPTYVDLQDLENLKTQNAILKENLELAERAKESNAKEAINKLEKEFNKDFVTNDAKLEKTKHNIYKNIKTSQEPSKLEQLLTLVDVFETLTSLKEQALKNGGTYTTESLPDFFRDFLGDSADITEIDYLIEANIGTLQSLNTDLLTKLNKLSEYDPNYESSYAKYLINLINETTKYLDFDTYINSTIEKAVASSDHAFDKIGETIKENIAKGIIKNESDLLSDEDAMKLVKYIAMEVYGASNDDTFKKAGSYIIKNLSDGIDTNYLAEKSLKSFEDIWNSSDFSDAKDKLLELAKAGTISAETIKSTEDYKSLIKDTGLTAEQATRKIMNLLSVQERLSAASNGIKSLENAYKEFKDEDIGFVTAATLESLPDVFKTLKTYDFSLFEQIVGDPKSGVDKIQQAFNDIATAYFVEQGTMNGLLEASESEVNSYIANLKQMGITNAEEVVANAQKSLKENGVLLSEAEKEYAKYLNNKEGYDVSYINSNLSKNGQLISQLGSAYKDDYNNWCELLKKKTEAYNQFVSAINKAQYNKLSSKNIASVEHAQEIVNESKGKVPKDLAKSQFGFTNKSLQNAVMGDAAARFGSSMQTISEYTSAEIKAAKEYIETVEQYNAVFDEINLDLTEANLNLNSGFNYISPSSSSSSSSSSDSSSNSDTSENFDWIERKIKKLTDALNDLKDSADDTYSTWANRSNALVNAINTTRQAIDLQQQAYNRYMQQAESVGLSSVYKNLVQNGALDISTISDENLKNTINQYKEWYDKAQDCLDTQRDLKNSLNELNSKKFDNIQSIFDFDKEKLEHSLTLLNNQIDKLEMKGLFANESYYNQMLQYTQKEINSLANERTQLASVMSSSGLSQDSEAWQNMYSTLLKIDEEMDDLNKDMIEFNNNIRDLNWEIFEYLEDSISRITDETEYFVSLFEDKKLFDDNGNFNKYANATVALHATAFDTYKQQAQDYLEEMRDLQRQVVAGAGKDVLEQYNKMVDAHQDAVLAANKEKQAILDLIEDGYKAQLEAIQKVIDKKKEQLNMEKNLYDYQKSITEKTKNIASLEKQQVSLADDDSEETMAKIQQIKVQLEEAKADLEETEYEQYLKDTQDMLDQLATDYENWMNDRLDNEDALLAEIVSEISSESSTIKATLNEVAKENGTTISTSLNTVFSTTSPFTTTLTNSINGVKNAVTGTTTAINNLLNKVASVTGTSVNGTNAGTRSTGTTNTTQNSSYSSNNSNSSNNNTNNSTNSSNSGLIAGIFISKSDNYPKSKLDKEHSIVDRLKYFNFDSSFSARGQYFSKLGGSGTYRGSSSQNTWLINQMKLKGYKKGTSHVPKKDNYLIQEDGQELIYDKSEGSFVIPQSSEPTIVPLNVGDMVFSNESVKRLYELASSGNFGGFANNLTPSINPIADNMKKMADSLQATNNISTSNEIHMDGDININLPGVTNYEQFRKELIGDNKFEKAIFTMIGNGMMGKSTIEKRKYVR